MWLIVLQRLHLISKRFTVPTFANNLLQHWQRISFKFCIYFPIFSGFVKIPPASRGRRHIAICRLVLLSRHYPCATTGNVAVFIPELHPNHSHNPHKKTRLRCTNVWVVIHHLKFQQSVTCRTCFPKSLRLNCHCVVVLYRRLAYSPLFKNHCQIIRAKSPTFFPAEDCIEAPF